MPIKLKAIRMEDQDVGGNRCLQLPETPTADLPAAAAGNEGQIAYDATLDRPTVSTGAAWVSMMLAGGTATFTGDALATHTHSVTATGSNAASVVTPGLHLPVDGVTVGTPALTHNADPVTNLSANPLFVVEAYGVGNKNIGVLQSNCNGTTSIVGAVDDVSGICGAATPRFFVTHNATPDGVQVYVDQADNDKLVCVSPTEQDVIVMMPFEAIADGVPGFAYAVTIHHVASITTETPLYFDDDGIADAQLIFVDAGEAGGVIFADDIEVVGPMVMGVAGNCGSAAAQAFTGSAADSTAVSGGTPAGTVVLS